ncbi:MAG: sulfite exporter TauE/SafE family protein [Nitrosopumilaceae archaeon]|uniref:Sulfite exporter TauE/SafE family protein n=1 Tax=Candidatus Nitrosomaritimum aestuariumsis TaxID=3342354 RepID=A0AC60WBH5_9ARCH|nr:sulfite exporter TauE/SafE family protein [Nitrosopumilaceae archaeon]MBA4464300.1 sulfite exporter TauE/SafE family protein [Nitrosopumilaceae archaeon]
MPVEFLLDPLALFLSILSGMAVGLSLGLLGGGGSVLAVPLLLYVVGVKDVHVAIGTSALAVGTIAAINLISHKRKNNVQLRTGFAFALPGLGGTLLGAQLGLLTPSENLVMFFALFMGVVGFLMLKRKTAQYDVQSSGKQSLVVLSKKNIPLSGFFVGALAGYFGIGGGFLIVPTLMYSGGLNILQAIGTSLVSVSAFGLTTASSYFVAGHVEITVAFLFVIGGVMGGLFGVKLTDKIPKESLGKIFAVVLFVISAYILSRTLFF